MFKRRKERKERKKKISKIRTLLINTESKQKINQVKEDASGFESNFSQICILKKITLCD